MENNQYESKIIDLEKQLVEKDKEINRMTARGLKVYEENKRLTSSPEIASKFAEMEYQLAMADKFIKSGAFPKMTPEQAYTIMKAGKEMGLSEVQSLNSLYCVNGSINLYGKAMVSKLTSNGYLVNYKDETPEQVVVEVTTPKGVVLEEKATIKDQIIVKSNATKISMKNKLRFHGVRMILNFRVPHLIEGVSDMFNEYVDHKPKDSSTTTISDRKEQARISQHIETAVKENDLDSLLMAEEHLSTPELETQFAEAKKQISHEQQV